MTRIVAKVAVCALLAAVPATARAGERISLGDLYLGLTASSGTADYGHRLERRNGAGIGFGVKLVAPMSFGPGYLGIAFTADAFGGPVSSSLDTWTGVYVNYRIDAGLVAGFDAGGVPVLFIGGGGIASDTAFLDDLLVTHWHGRVRTFLGGHAWEAGFTYMPERLLAQVFIGGMYALSQGDPRVGVSWEVRDSFGLQSQNGGLEARAAAGLQF